MKRIFKTMVMAILAVSIASLVGCKKENEINPIPEVNDTTESSFTLGGTSWVGVYDDTFQGYDAKLIWSLDFTSETEGEFFLELTVAGQPQGNYTVPFTYTFDGINGVMTGEMVNNVPFTYHPADSTITIEMVIGASTGSDELVPLGGMTTFYLRGTGHDPDDGGGNGGGDEDDGVVPGEITNEFPANTTWLASESITYHHESFGDIPLDLHYELIFQNDHIALMNITVEAFGTTNEPQQIRFNWTYDSNTQEGSFITKGVPLPFHYDSDNDQISTEFSFDYNGGGSTSGNLTFTRSTQKAINIVLL